MKKIYILFVLLTVCLSALAQTETIQRAKERMQRFEYNAAIKLLENEAAKKNAKVEVLEMTGDCYRLMGNKVKALTYYQKAVRMEGGSPELYRNTGLILLSNGKYQEAKNIFQAYTDSLSGTVDVSLQVATCDTAMAWIAKKDSSVFQVSIMPRVNSRYSDWGATLFKGNLIFTSDRPNSKQKETGYYTMYQARAARNKPGTFNAGTVLYSSLMGNKHVGPMIFSGDQKIMFYTQTNTDVTYRKQTESGKVWESKFEILTARVGSGGPTGIKSFKYNSPRKYSVGHPCLSPNDSTLYFASDMPGGYGGVDLYFCRREAGDEWSEPENCGPLINSEGNEMFPTMDSTGVLYFSSNGRVGLGGLDIYRASGNCDKWNAVENMLYPVNSSGDDFYLIFNPDHTSGYLSSNRPEGVGSDDIYQFTLSGPLPDFGFINNPKKFEMKVLTESGVVFRGTVTAQGSGKPVEGASISFVDNVYKTQTICTSNAKGEFTTSLHKDRAYTYSCIRDGYVPAINQLLSSSDTSAQKNGIAIVMPEVKAKEENVIAQNVLLDTGEGAGIEYSVQVMASKEYPNWNYLNRISEEYPKLKVYYGSFPDAFTRFTVGRFKTVREATRLKNDLRKIGYSDAFVVMFIDGERKVVSYN